MKSRNRTPEREGLDSRTSLEIAQIINREDQTVGRAVEKSLPQIAQAIDAVAEALYRGGRLIYVGAGTSGRIAALDAAECPPTFNSNPREIQFVIAGGERALANAVETIEDSHALGRRDLARLRPGRKDVVVGIAASGSTPYTVAAIEYARKKGARTVAVVCRAGSPLGKAAEIEIVADVGPEALSGSTRMKAGTAQKMILNMLTTGAMARLGRIYGNLMVYLSTNNAKLRERALAILEEAAGIDRANAIRALQAAGNEVPVALVMIKTGLTRAQTHKRLKSTKGNVRKAIEGR
jgi:N-acetylmuramic acid 6-phosphate etherase